MTPVAAVSVGNVTPLILPTVVDRDPAVLVTSPVSAGIAAVGSVVWNASVPAESYSKPVVAA